MWCFFVVACNSAFVASAAHLSFNPIIGFHTGDIILKVCLFCQDKRVSLCKWTFLNYFRSFSLFLPLSLPFSLSLSLSLSLSTFHPLSPPPSLSLFLPPWQAFVSLSISLYCYLPPRPLSFSLSPTPIHSRFPSTRLLFNYLIYLFVIFP